MAAGQGSWNHNTHFHERLLRLLPSRMDRSLDVGCGDGRFAAALASRSSEVLALDSDGGEVVKAREQCRSLPNVTVEHADFLGAALAEESYDAVTALASLHHMDLAAATAQVRRVLRPGGTFVLLGVWTDTRRQDLPWNVASVLLHRSLRWRRGVDEMSSPAMLPATPFLSTRAELRAALPGAVVRRHLLWRYTVCWRKPA